MQSDHTVIRDIVCGRIARSRAGTAAVWPCRRNRRLSTRYVVSAADVRRLIREGWVDVILAGDFATYEPSEKAIEYFGDYYSP